METKSNTTALLHSKCNNTLFCKNSCLNPDVFAVSYDFGMHKNKPGVLGEIPTLRSIVLLPQLFILINSHIVNNEIGGMSIGG